MREWEIFLRDKIRAHEQKVNIRFHLEIHWRDPKYSEFNVWKV